MKCKSVVLQGPGDIVTARQVCREMARELGFGSADCTRLATAVSEVARNAVQYAGGGICEVTDESNEDTAVVRVVVEDHGPGIVDVDKALEQGFSTSGGLGTGLPSAKRLVHEFTVKSQPGHTIVNLRMSRKKR